MAELAVDRGSCECGCGTGPGEHCRKVIGVDGEGHVLRDGRRVCACGTCGKRLPANAPKRQRNLNERHRKRKHRVSVRAAAEAAGMPVSLSLKSIEAAGTTGERPRDAATARRRATRGPRPGVSPYFQPGDAEAVVEALNDLSELSPALTRAREALAAAIDRRNRRHQKRR